MLNADGTYTYTLDTTYDGATNNNGVTTEPNVEGFNYTVTDANGNTTTGTINVSIVDDVPSIGIVQPALNVTNVAGTVFTGTFDLTSGADQPVIASLLGNTVPAGLSSGGQLVSYYVDPGNPGCWWPISAATELPAAPRYSL